MGGAKARAPLAAEASRVRARPPPHVPHTWISGDAPASSRVRLPPLALSSPWRRGEPEFSAQPLHLVTSRQVRRGSKSFKSSPSGHRATLSLVPGARAGWRFSDAGQLAPTPLAFRPGPADAAASSPRPRSGLPVQDHSGPRPSRDWVVDWPAVALFLEPFHSRGYI